MENERKRQRWKRKVEREWLLQRKRKRLPQRKSEKDEAFQATKERAKEKETSWLESATTVESLVTTNLSAGRKKEILEVSEKSKKKMRRVLQVAVQQQLQ